jgi:hypothetical protein
VDHLEQLFHLIAAGPDEDTPGYIEPDRFPRSLHAEGELLARRRRVTGYVGGLSASTRGAVGARRLRVLSRVDAGHLKARLNPARRPHPRRR